MTNRDYFLKDNVSVEEFAKSIVARFFGDDCFSKNDYLRIKNWAEDNCITLTEDERVILRNIPKEFTTIARNLVGELSARNKDTWRYADVFNHLFQFIKERRRIFY